MLKRLLVSLGTLVGTVVLFGCSSSPTVPLASEADGMKKTHIRLETKSQLLVIHKLAAAARCEKVKDWVRVFATGPGKDPKFETSCSLVGKAVVAVTKEFLPAGDYYVTVETSLAASRFEGKPVVTANPQDAEAKSGPDQDFGGAVELAENQTVKGSLSHAEANATNWIAIKPKGEVSLFFLPEETSDVQAKLFHLPKGAKTPRRIGALAPKSKRHVRVTDGMLYVQISSKKYSGVSNYTLTRRDTPATKAVNVAVIDCYPVNASSSVVLLKASDAVKVNDELQVSARKADGSNVAVGKCTVTSTSESQVSCRMEAVPAPDLSQYRAQLVKEEGNS